MILFLTGYEEGKCIDEGSPIPGTNEQGKFDLDYTN